MLDRTGDWCFEGGCTYLTNTDTKVDDLHDRAALAAMNLEPCVGSFD